MKVTREVFGQLPDNGEASLFTAINPDGLQLKVSNYGGIIQSILVPDKKGIFTDVVLGFDTLEGYLEDHPFIGTLVGRYANRIARGQFTLEGTDYKLARNNGGNHLHGGLKGYDKVLWEAAEFADDNGAGVTLTYLSHDMEEGYPGNLKVRVTFTLDKENQVCIDYKATSDSPTPINLTHHGYFNLGGGSSAVYDHELMIDSDHYVVGDAELIPTGEIGSLDGSPLDFRTPKLIGSDINNVEGGFDHCYVLGDVTEDPRFAARVVHPPSGRVMEVLTTEPGVQFYSSNFLEGLTGKGGQSYNKHQALCLETQHFPDSPNHPEFPTTILRPGETYTQKTIYKFSTR
ncbi:aldose epimerase family protein [Bacteroidota bacterium]